MENVSQKIGVATMFVIGAGFAAVRALDALERRATRIRYHAPPAVWNQTRRVPAAIGDRLGLSR